MAAVRRAVPFGRNVPIKTDWRRRKPEERSGDPVAGDYQDPRTEGGYGCAKRLALAVTKMTTIYF